MSELNLDPHVKRLVESYLAAVGQLGTTPTPSLANEAIQLAARILDDPSLAPDTAEAFQPELARRLLDRLRIPGGGGDPVTDVACADQLIELAAKGRSWPPHYSIEVGDGYRRRYLVTRDRADAERAIGLLVDGLQQLAPNDPVRPIYTDSLLDLYTAVWDHSHASWDLDRAMEGIRFVLSLPGLSPVERAATVIRSATLRRQGEVGG
jgi:hypothetical protein